MPLVVKYVETPLLNAGAQLVRKVSIELQNKSIEK